MSLLSFHEQIRDHPARGWFGSIFSTTLGITTFTYQSIAQNVDMATKIFAMFAAVLGAFAGLYTLMIQRRNFKRGYRPHPPKRVQQKPELEALDL